MHSKFRGTFILPAGPPEEDRDATIRGHGDGAYIVTRSHFSPWVERGTYFRPAESLRREHGIQVGRGTFTLAVKSCPATHHAP